MAYEGIRALVLGAGGFVGRWVARALAAAGAEVYGGLRPGGRRPDLPGTLRTFDLLDPGALLACLSWARPQIVFNLVGYGVRPEEGDPARSHALNAALPARLGQALVAGSSPGSRPRIIHVGSGLEYGPVGGDLSPEGPCAPHTRYGRDKLEGSLALSALLGAGALEGAVARLFTVYGPEDNPHKLWPTLARAAGGSGPIPLTAGSQRRDFIFVGDVVAALLRLGLTPEGEGDDGAHPPIVNLGSGRLSSVRRFIEGAAGALGIPPERLGFGALPTRGDEMAHLPITLAGLRRRIGSFEARDQGAGFAACLRGAL